MCERGEIIPLSIKNERSLRDGNRVGCGSTRKLASMCTFVGTICWSRYPTIGANDWILELAGGENSFTKVGEVTGETPESKSIGPFF